MSVTDLDKMSGNLTGNIGTTLYLAPEVRSNIRAKYNNKVDLYSLGVIFFEMCHPFSSMHERAITIQVWPGTRGVEARPQSVVPLCVVPLCVVPLCAVPLRPLTITRLFSCHGPSTATAQARDYLSRRLVLGARRLPQDHRTAVAAQVRLMSTSTLQPAPRRALTHHPPPFSIQIAHHAARPSDPVRGNCWRARCCRRRLRGARCARCCARSLTARRRSTDRSSAPSSSRLVVRRIRRTRMHSSHSYMSLRCAIVAAERGGGLCL